MSLIPSRKIRTAHNLIVMCGLSVGLWYLSDWLWVLVNYTFQGASFPLIVAASAYLALQELWHKRNKLAKLIAPVQQRRLGDILILTGAVLFPLCRFAFWSQALLWLLILAGIALSSWGLEFFKKYPRPIFFILLSVHPTPDIIVGQLWTIITPHNTLEHFMAWMGSLALQAIGQSATATDIYIYLPTGGVEVGWGCSGFNMAFTIAATGLLLGLTLNQSWLKTLWLVILGVALAFIFNVPRIVLLTLAAVFWGEKSFEFWHGAWGGQIFSTLLFTAYYYLVMSIVNHRPLKSQT